MSKFNFELKIFSTGSTDTVRGLSQVGLLVGQCYECIGIGYEQP